MRVHLGADHAGFELKNDVAERLRAAGHDVVDHGPHVYDAQDDYPPYCLRAAEAVVADGGSLGVVIGGSGNGEQIAANKVRGARCALAWSLDTARLGRQHNDANLIAIGARQHSVDEATVFVMTFVEEPFSHDPRHQRRIDMLSSYEATGELPPLPAPPPPSDQKIQPQWGATAEVNAAEATARAAGSATSTSPAPASEASDVPPR
jgi:ribose 5-phosphate isomerase B